MEQIWIRIAIFAVLAFDLYLAVQNVGIYHN